ncbi:MAG: carbohydrate ABC transporter permease [Micromonosporaceae bacterium]
MAHSAGSRLRDPGAGAESGGQNVALPARWSRRLRRRLGEHLFVLPALLFVLVVMGYPLLYNVDLTLHDVTVGNVVYGNAPFAGLDNYREVLSDGEVWHSLLVTLVYTGGSIALSFVAGFALATFFRQGFPGSRLMQALLLLGWVLPTVATGTVWRWVLEGDYGVVNAALTGLGVIDHPVFWLAEAQTAMLGVVFATVWVTAPFMMILLLAGLRGIPEQIYEAARLDGASSWQQFRHLTFPIMRPVSLTVLLLATVLTFKTFDNVYVMTRGGPGEATNVLAIHSYQQAFEFFHFSEGAVTTILLLTVTLLLSGVYFLFSRGEETS